jgi:hypothetical protein
MSHKTDLFAFLGRCEDVAAGEVRLLRAWELTPGMPLARQSSCRLARHNIQHGARQAIETLVTLAAGLADAQVKRSPSQSDLGKLNAIEQELSAHQALRPGMADIPFQNALLRIQDNCNNASGTAATAFAGCTADVMPPAPLPNP